MIRNVWFSVACFALVVGCNLSDPGANNGNQNNQNNSNNANNTNNANNATCDPACVNGTCSADVCECDDGYTGDACDECAPDFQDNDGDGVCEPTCATIDCLNGTCDDAGGTALCECEDGYAGELCDACEEDYQDNNMDGTCEPTCADSGLECGDAVCDDTSGTPECVCPVGTALEAGTCELAVPLDPSFQALDWNPYGGAGLSPNDAGSVDPGVGMMGEAAICTMDSGFSQTYSLAPSAEVGALKARISYDVGQSCNDFCTPGAHGPAIRLNDSAFDFTFVDRPFSSTQGYQQIELCVGEAFHGQDVEIDLASAVPYTGLSCPAFLYQGLEAIDNFHFERLDGVDPYECPMVGFAKNSDFEGPDDGTPIPGWEYQGAATAVGEVIDIGGNNQMHLFADTRCANATATSELSVPLAAGQALRFDYRATLGSRIQFVLDGIPTNLRDQAALAEFRQCIPSYMAGTVVTAEFRTQTPGSGSCADVVPRELFVDNVEVVTDTRCQSAEGFVNGDFARNGVGWQEQNQSFYGAGVSVSYQNLAGEKVASIRGDRCSNVGVSQTVILPPPDIANAIEYTYRMLDTSGTQGRITAVSGPFGRSSTSFSVNDDLPQTGVDAVTQTFCFPPGAAGHPWTFNITSRARGGGSCADVAPARLELAELKMVQAVCP